MLLPAYGNLVGAEAFPLAETSIDKAMSMDDSVSEVWSSLGYLRLFQANAPAAERAFLRALELDDRNATAWGWYAIALNRMRRYDEAGVALENAYALEPMVRPINVGLANHYWLDGDFVRARQMYERLPLIDDSLALQSAIKVADMHFEEGAPLVPVQREHEPQYGSDDRAV